VRLNNCTFVGFAAVVITAIIALLTFSGPERCPIASAECLFLTKQARFQGLVDSLTLKFYSQDIEDPETTALKEAALRMDGVYIQSPLTIWVYGKPFKEAVFVSLTLFPKLKFVVGGRVMIFSELENLLNHKFSAGEGVLIVPSFYWERLGYPVVQTSIEYRGLIVMIKQ
jgi:hypothetical protein